VTKIILVRWVIGSFGVCLCVGLCEGANPKCANAGWLKLFFKMCGGKIFKTLRWVSVGKMVWSVSSYSEIVNEFLSPENLFGSQKSGRFGVRLIVARSSFRLAYNEYKSHITGCPFHAFFCEDKVEVPLAFYSAIIVFYY
jgi:hypothetical protein